MGDDGDRARRIRPKGFGEAMSLRLNIVANYASQFYVAFVGVFLVPVYLRLMGAEAYGLVGFFMMMQAWFQLLDFGLTATISRETARYLGGGLDALALRRLLRSLEGCFWAIGIAAAVAIACAAPTVALHWLKIQRLSPIEVEVSLSIMGLTVAARWIGGLYRGAISGLERQVWLGLFNIAVVTARFVGVLPLLIFVSVDPVPFFIFQAVVCSVELVVLLLFAYALIPLPVGTRNRWSWRPLRTVFKFSATVAFTSAVWVVVTQTDKLLISKLLPLEEYGFFTAAVLVASAITLISGPVTQALLPRLTRLSQQSDVAGVVALYRQATQGIAAIAGSASVVMAVFAEQILWAWTGNAPFAAAYAPVLALYAIGNGFLSLAAFPYYLQFAYGDLHLHFRGNVLFVAVLLPAILFATARFGAVGAGTVWALTNGLFFVCWTPLVHRKFIPGLHRQWLVQDVLKVLAFPIFLVPLLWIARDLRMGRTGTALFIALTALALIALALARSVLLRVELATMLRRMFRPLKRSALGPSGNP